MKKRGNRPALRRRPGRGSDVPPARHSLPLPFDSQSKAIKKDHPYGWPFYMVEMGGIEPPSESTLTETSPGADGYLHSLIPARAVTLRDLVAS